MTASNIRDFSSQAQRIDLSLRDKHPYLKTRLFVGKNGHFKILVENHVDDFQHLNEKFNKEIKYVWIPITLTNAPPCHDYLEIPTICDQEIPQGFTGIPFTVFQLTNLIESKFPNIQISSVDENFEEGSITFNCLNEVSGETKKALQDFTTSLKMPFTCLIKDCFTEREIRKPENPVFYISSSQDMKRLELPFLRRDEELWFENVDQIYNGTFRKEHLFFYDNNKRKCFLDFISFKNINLRNNLLLYDIIYCTLPLTENVNDFFKYQQITRKEFLYLIESGRVRVILTQPEIRHDCSLLREIYEVCPQAIVSRRALAALCAADIVSINDNYLFNDESFTDLLIPFASAFSEVFERDFSEIINFMLWPKMALRSSFELLHDASTKRISNYGVNNIALNALPSDKRADLEFEFTVTAESIHIAHALDATYFPYSDDKGKFTDKPFAIAMGELLNFYKCFNSEHYREYSSPSFRISSSVNTLDPINIIEVNHFADIHTFLRDTSSSLIRKGFRSIFDELSALDQGQRNDRIREYNIEIDKINSKRGSFVCDFAEDTFGLVTPYLNTLRNIGSSGINKLKDKFPATRSPLEKIEEFGNTNITGDNNITLLTRISRVARLKKDYGS